jgi:uncharacterized protein involved in response to NO
MTNSLKEAPAKTLPPIWMLAFRPFFLAGSVFAVIAMAIWLVSLMTTLPLGYSGNPVFWHAHEMIFGFSVAIVVGFLLTAVQNWTGIRSIHGLPLAGLALVWLIPRIGMLFLDKNIWISAIDISFIPLAGFYLARPVIKAKQWHNLVFIPVLAALTLINAAAHYCNLTGNTWYAMQWIDTAVFMIVMMILIVGGRVIPFFTENALKDPRRPAIPYLAPFVAAMVIAYASSNLVLGRSDVTGALALICALASAVHIGWWFKIRALQNPLLWSLHFSCWFIPVGFVLIGLENLTGLVPLQSGLHAITTGAIGGMILSMMSRVSLGHTGRPLMVHPQLVLAYLLIILAALTRALSPIFIGSFSLNYSLPALFWCAAFALFLRHYAGPLIQRRADGRPG